MVGFRKAVSAQPFLQLLGLLFFTIKFVCTLECPKCGNTIVPYPLSTRPECGHPDYPVICNAKNILQLIALSGSYPIRSIDSRNRTLIIGTGAFLESSCITEDSQNHNNFSLNANQPYSLTRRNTIMLFNCSSSLQFSPLVCSKASPCYKVLETQAKNCKNQLCCSFNTSGGDIFKYSFPISGQETAYVGAVDLDTREPSEKWTYGLQLGWPSPTEPPCSSQADCGGNSTCSTVSRDSGPVCLCNGGHYWDALTGSCPQAPFCVRRRGNINCHKAAYATGIACGLAAIVISVLIVTVAYRRWHSAKSAREKLVRDRYLILSANSGGKSAKLFSSQEMRRATDAFAKDRLLGSGGFGEVYKGALDDGTVVAIKSAKLGNTKGVDQVLNEVGILAQVNHRNLVRLIGCCVETDRPIMVYEYVPNGSLFDHLHGCLIGTLHWMTRLRIALQSAEGLAYLHFAAYPPIYHRDVKSSNILLDEALNAKVSDFGLSRLAEPDLTHVSTCAQGTLGYLDPEYYRNYQLTDKSDVYSFGMVLLELVTGQKAIDLSRAQDEVNLAVYVEQKARDRRIGDVLDPQLVAMASNTALASMEEVAILALHCLEENRTERPNMKQVVDQLHRIISSVTAGDASGEIRR